MEEKYAYRFPPCPSYDVEGMESWLETMAKKGLILDKDPFFAGFATFRKEKPGSIRYRLQPSAKKRGQLDEAALELAEAFGWAYLGECGEFSIYATKNPDAREPDTDPQVQAMALHSVLLRRRNNLIGNIVLLLFFLGMILWLGPVRYLSEQPVWYGWLLAVVWFSYLFGSFLELRQLKQLKKRLNMGDSLSRDKDWRRRRWLHWSNAIFSVLLLIVFFGGTIYARVFDWKDHRWQPREEVLPFATAADLGAFIPPEDWLIQSTDHVATRSTLLAGEQTVLRQYGRLSGNDILLDVDYYDLRAQWLAKELYRELAVNARREKDAPVACPELPTEDEQLSYNRGEVLLLREGNRVLRVRFLQLDEQIPAEIWTKIFAEAFKEASNKP